MIVKEHKSKSGLIVALCDEKIMGEKFLENGLVLDLSSDFYKGKKSSEKEAEERCKRAYIINAVGKESVQIIRKLGLIGEKNIIKIKGIPFAQCLIVENEI